jgi:hypothetical protein
MKLMSFKSFKKSSIMLVLLFSIYSCSKNRVHSDELIISENGRYIKDGKPFNGIAYTLWGSKGWGNPNQVMDECEIKDGVRIKITHYYSDGSEYEVTTFEKNGRYHTEYYFKNGEVNKQKTNQYIEMNKVARASEIADSIALHNLK